MERSPLSWRQVAFCTMLIGAITLLLVSHDTAALAVREGLLLCGQSVIPSLFPFFVTVSFAVRCRCGAFLPPEMAVLLLGLVGGYPIGAKTLAELVKSGVMEQREAQRLLLCCNNAGPAFILGILGHGVFHRAAVGWALYGIHALSALLLFALLPHRKTGGQPVDPPVSYAAAFVAAVGDGVRTMANVCGFVVLFLAALRLLTAFTGVTHPLILGAVELINGAQVLPNDSGGFVMAAALLGWGGLSVHCQTAAVLEGSGLKLWPYLLTKLAQAGISAALAFVLRGWIFG